MQKLKKILSLLLLISFALFFAHSELSLFSETNDSDLCRDKHKGHDYCEIVKDARIVKTDNFQKKIISQDILFNYDDCCTKCKKIENNLQNTDFSSAKKFFNVDTFLLNKSLLI